MLEFRPKKYIKYMLELINQFYSIYNYIANGASTASKRDLTSGIPNNNSPFASSIVMFVFRQVPHMN